RKIVVAGGDEDLGPPQRVAAVGIRGGGGEDVRERRSRLRLRHCHGPEEAAREQVPKVALLLLRRGKGGEQRGGADGERDVRRGPDVGSSEDRLAGAAYRRRQLHASPLVVLRGGKEAGRDVRVERLLHLRDEVDALPIEGRLVLVRLPVVWRELLL